MENEEITNVIDNNVKDEEIKEELEEIFNENENNRKSKLKKRIQFDLSSSSPNILLHSPSVPIFPPTKYENIIEEYTNSSLPSQNETFTLIEPLSSLPSLSPTPSTSLPILPPAHLSATSPHNQKYIEQVNIMDHFFQNIISTIPATPPVLLGEPEEIDVTISGGGTKGYYVVGAYAVLLHFIKTNKIKVMRWAGASVGAASAVFMCCGVSPLDWVSTYWQTRKNIVVDNISIAEGFRERANELLPDNAHEICNGKVFISITKLGLTGPYNVIVSHFESKEDLIEGCVASLSIPFITSKKVTAKFRGERVWDGGVTNNSPLFSDSPSLSRRQLYFQVSKAAYPANMSFQFNDTCIESLVARGALLMRQFLLGQISKRTHEIQWYVAPSAQSNEEKKEFPSNNIGNLIRNSLTKIRSAPNLLKFNQNIKNEPIKINVDENTNFSNEEILINSDQYLNELPMIPIVHHNTVKEFIHFNKKRFLRATLFLLFVFTFLFFLSKQGNLGKSSKMMRIPIPQGLSFLASILPLRHTLSLR